MKYLIRLENTRTSQHDAFFASAPCSAAPVIGCGSYEHNPDGISYWTFTSFEPQQ